MGITIFNSWCSWHRHRHRHRQTQTQTQTQTQAQTQTQTQRHFERAMCYLHPLSCTLHMIILTICLTFGHVETNHRKYIFFSLDMAILQIFLSDAIAFLSHNLSNTKPSLEFVGNYLPQGQKSCDKRVPNSIDSHLSTQSVYQDYPASCVVNVPT